MNLCKAGNTRLHRMSAVITQDRLPQTSDDFGPLGPRANETHVSAQDIPELRKFVEVQFPQDSANGCNARIVGWTPARSGFTLAIVIHCPDLIEREHVSR